MKPQLQASKYLMKPRQMLILKDNL